MIMFLDHVFFHQNDDQWYSNLHVDIEVFHFMQILMALLYQFMSSNQTG